MSIDYRELYHKHFFVENQLPHCPIWHYTSIDGLMGIIRRAKEDKGKLHFWFTRSDCLNDISEGKHVLDLYRNVCSELYNSYQLDETFYTGIKDIDISAHQLISYPIPSESKTCHKSIIDSAPCDVFICSFSQKEDSLDMWRYYSKGTGGYGLKLNTSLFSDYLNYEISDFCENKEFSSMKACQVIYDPVEKKKILQDAILDVFSVYSADTEDYEDEEGKIKRAKQFIQSFLKELQYRFKHECYSSEEEFRFVFYRPYSEPTQLKNKLPEIEYRKQNGMVIPYIDITVDNGCDYLEEVLISPFVGNETALCTTSDYLSECGFFTKTVLSTLPVRK